MRTNYKGRFTKMSLSNPRAIGTCDRSGIMGRRADFVKQYAYRGRGLVWTGIFVLPKYYDEPNPQELAPIIKPDPVPIPNPRPDNLVLAQQTLETSVGVITIDVTNESSLTLTSEQYSNGSFYFTGNLISDIIVYIPGIFNTFYIENNTTGDFTFNLQVSGLITPPLVLAKNTTFFVQNSGTQIQFIPYNQ